MEKKISFFLNNLRTQAPWIQFHNNVHNYNKSTENIKYCGSIISKLWSIKYDTVILWNATKTLWKHRGNIKSLVRKHHYQNMWYWGGIIKPGIINNKVTPECPRNNGIVFGREDKYLLSSFSGTLLSINYIHSLCYWISSDFGMSWQFLIRAWSSEV